MEGPQRFNPFIHQLTTRQIKQSVVNLHPETLKNELFPQKVNLLINLKALSTIVADNSLIFLFIFFRENKSSCAGQSIHMKCQVLISLENHFKTRRYILTLLKFSNHYL